MKKYYIKPETNEILVKIESHMLAGSGESSNYDDPTITPPIDDDDDI